MSNTQIHSPYATNVRKSSHTEYPADLLKFNAWKNPVENFEEAVKIISLKKLVLGEPAVVPFKFTHSDGSVTLELAFGIGSGGVQLFSFVNILFNRISASSGVLSLKREPAQLSR